MIRSIKGVLKSAMRFSGLGRPVLAVWRLWIGFGFIWRQKRRVLSWWIRSRESTNFTYDLHPLNRSYLAHFVAHVTHKPVSEIEGYIQELLQDEALKVTIQAQLRASRRNDVDLDVFYGRRIGWYAIIRAVQPTTVIETGVEKGLGAMVCTAALRRNASDGHPGYYYGTDIDPVAGFLLTEPYSSFGKILVGDSIESLKGISDPIDVLINDSDHSAEYEAREYDTVARQLSDMAIIIGDNAHSTDKLAAFAQRTGRQFLFFQERSIGHWYPGAGIGVAFSATSK